MSITDNVEQFVKMKYNTLDEMKKIINNYAGTGILKRKEELFVNKEQEYLKSFAI